MLTAYTVFLLSHSWLRWIVLLLSVAALVVGVRGWIGKRTWTAADKRVGLFWLISVDLQLLLGLVLYLFLSPYSRVVWHQPKMAMQMTEFRFWGVEHAFGMLLGVVLMHLFWARAKHRYVDGGERHRTFALGVIGMLVCALVTMPWPGLPYGRPLARTASPFATDAGER